MTQLSSDSEQSIDSPSIPLMDAPYHVNWNITYRCNFNCVHCYSRAHSDAQELSLDDKIKVAHNIIKSRVFSVNLGGGEPLVSEDTRPVIAQLAQSGVNVCLSSNGWQFDEATVTDLKRLKLGSFSFSVDNVDSQLHDAFRGRQGSYHAVLEAIQTAHRLGMPVFISTVLTSENFPTLENLVTMLDRLGCSGMELKRLRMVGNAKERSDLCLTAGQEELLYPLVAQLKQRCSMPIHLMYQASSHEGIDEGCPCGKTVLSILSNGDVTPCNYSNRIVGNALNEQLDVLWRESPALLTMRRTGTCLGLELDDDGTKTL